MKHERERERERERELKFCYIWKRKQKQALLDQRNRFTCSIVFEVTENIVSRGVLCEMKQTRLEKKINLKSPVLIRYTPTVKSVAFSVFES